MAKSLLITRPQHDIVTEYLTHWSHDIIVFAEEKGYLIKDLGGKEATRDIFEKYLTKVKTDFIFLNGHGTYDIVCGHKDKPLLIKDNSELTKEAIIYALSCNSAKNLGPHCVENGAKSYLGYQESFGFVTDSNSECTPLEDEYANIFRDIVSITPYSLLKGNSVRESIAKTKSAFKEAIIKLSTSNSKDEFKDIRFWLFWNMTNLVCIGDEGAKLIP